MLFYGMDLDLRFRLCIDNVGSWGWELGCFVGGLDISVHFIKSFLSLRVVRRRYSNNFWLIILIYLFHLAILQLVFLSRVNSCRALTHWLYFYLRRNFSCGPHLLVDQIRAQTAFSHPGLLLNFTLDLFVLVVQVTCVNLETSALFYSVWLFYC